MAAMIETMNDRSARARVSLAANLAGACPSVTRRSVEGKSDRSEVVYLIASDCHVRESVLVALTANGVNVRSFDSAGEFLQYSRNDAAACIVADLQAEDMTDPELQEQLIRGSGLPIVFIGTSQDMPAGIRALKAGALDFLLHPVGLKELCCAVGEAFKRHRFSRQRQTETAAIKVRYLSLTRREREVFALVVQGFLNKQVAAILAISLVTVQIHRDNTMRKMGARSFADLVCMAMTLQILDQHLEADNSSARVRYRFAQDQAHGIVA